MNIAALAWLDTFALAASLPAKDGLWKSTGDPGLRNIRHRGVKTGTEGEDEQFVTYTPTVKWVELVNLRKRIERLGDGFEMGCVWLQRLDAGALLPWRQEDDSRWQRAMVAIRSNPGVIAIYGTEVLAPAIGVLNAVSPRVMHTWANHGSAPFVALALDFRRKDHAT